MPIPISETEQKARAVAQQVDKAFRKEFLGYDSRTQAKIIRILKNMSDYIEQGNPKAAEKYFFKQAGKRRPLFGKDGINWSEAIDQIRHFCIDEGGDMGVPRLVPGRVNQALTIFTSLSEIETAREDF